MRPSKTAEAYPGLDNRIDAALDKAIEPYKDELERMAEEEVANRMRKQEEAQRLLKQMGSGRIKGGVKRVHTCKHPDRELAAALAPRTRWECECGKTYWLLKGTYGTRNQYMGWRRWPFTRWATLWFLYFAILLPVAMVLGLVLDGIASMLGFGGIGYFVGGFIYFMSQLDLDLSRYDDYGRTRY